MFLRTLWYFLNIVFCIYNVNNVVRNRFTTLVEYQKDRLEEDYLSVCLNISASRLACEKARSEAVAQACHNLRDLFAFIENKSLNKTPNEIILRAEQMNLSSYFVFRSGDSNDSVTVHQNQYYLNQNHFCMSHTIRLVPGKTPAGEENFFKIRLANRFNFSYTVYFHGPDLPRLIGYSEVVKCLPNFSRCKNFQAQAKQYPYYYLPSPYDTACIDYSRAKIPFKSIEPVDSKQACIQECLKQHYRSSLFSYTKRDRLSYQLDSYNDLDQIEPDTVMRCERICPRSVCSVYYHTFFRVNYIDDDHMEIQLMPEIYKCQTVPGLSEFDFWAQTFGFISLTFGVNFFNLFQKILGRLKRYSATFRRIQQERRAFFDLLEKLVLIALYAIGFAISNYHFFEYYHLNLRNTTVLSISGTANNLTLSLCLTLNFTKGLQNLTFAQIERESKKYKELAAWPVFKFEDDEKPVKSELKVFYLAYEKDRPLEGFSKIFKCFTFDLFLDELRYRHLLSNTKLLLNITNFESIFVTEYGKLFAGTYKHLHMNYKLRLIERRRLGNCKNYDLQTDGCDSQESCRERCYIEKYLAAHSFRLPADNIIYEHYFNESLKEKIYFDLARVDQENRPILDECEANYPLEDCTHVILSQNPVPLYENPPDLRHLDSNISLSLYFDKMVSQEQQRLNRLDFTLDILTVTSILIGLNLPLFLSFLIKKLSCHFERIGVLKNYLFIVCMVGFSVHLKTILQDTFFSELWVDYIYRFNYLNANERIPNLIFCLNHSEVFRNNQKINGHLLDQRLATMNYSYLFKEIVYYDQDLRRKIWRPENERNFKHLVRISQNFQIRYFFFLSYKCYELIYKLNHLHYKNGLLNTIMTIRLKNDIQQNKIIFNLKQNSTDDINDYFDIYPNFSYKLNFEYFSLSSLNLYQKFASPMLLFKTGYKVNDATDFINMVKDDFRTNCNLTTKRLSLHYEDWKYEIQDKMFEQFNLQYVKKQEKMGLVDFNFRRTSFRTTTYYLDEKFNGKSNIYISKIFAFNKIKYRNKSDFYSFFVKALNSFTFWFNLPVIDFVELLLDANYWRWTRSLRASRAWLRLRFFAIFAIFRAKRRRRVAVQMS